MSNMKDCPFCGSAVDDNDCDSVYPVTRADENGQRIYRAGCIEASGGCGAEVHHFSAEEAVELWNTRVGENDD